MSCYRCEHCENYFDADEVGCYENPKDNKTLLCESCIEEFACHICGDTMSPNYCDITELTTCSSCLSD